MTFGSLFSGIGGLDLGLERSGMRCVWQVEIDEYCRKVLTKHWPEVPKYEDVRTVGRHNLAECDLICGGFPCQDISYAGQGAGLAGDRSGLWSEFARIVDELRPHFVLVENVSALLNRGLDAVLGTLASFGYDAEWHCLPAAAIGAPHIRDRLFLLAYTDSQQWDAFGDAYCLPNGRIKKVVGGWTKSKWGTHRHEFELVPRHCLARMWEPQPDVLRVLDGVPCRVDRLRGLGNAVVPQVAEFIGRRIMEAS